MKENLALIFGGVSSEHDISIVSALQALTQIDNKFYNVIPIYVSQNSKWYVGKQLADISNFANLDLNKLHEVTFVLGNNVLYKKSVFGFVKKLKVDCALIVMHGNNGEDGKVMAMLDLCGVPYTSANPTESGLCLDKSLFKACLNGLNVNNVDGVTLFDENYYANPEKCLIEAESLSYPLIVKPATQGSSIGITVCKNREQLQTALNTSFGLASKTLVEKYLENITEINIAILKNGNELMVSELEQPIKSNEILSFENKYLNDSNSLQSVKRIIPAKISKNIKLEIIETAKYVYSKIGLKGVVRFDFIINDGKVYINEVNTIPGSLAFYLFKPKGVEYSELINILIKNAYEDFLKLKNKVHNFPSQILHGGVNSIKK